MLRFFPSPFPYDLKENPERRAESKVYHAFKEQITDKHTIFYNTSWLGKPREGPPMDGEADFVVAHPKLGFMVIEVKGGGIGRDRKSGRWTSTDRHGRRHRIENPFTQAVRTKHALIGKVKEMPVWRRRWIDAGHGVIFPDSQRPEHSMGAESVHEVAAFADDMGWLDKWLETAFEYWSRQDNGKYEIGHEGIKILEDLLAPTFELKQPLSVDLHEDDREIIRLTREQFDILDLLSRQRRVAISGGAGTGKTMLALEKSMRLADEGFRTLLTCFNRPLANYLHERAGEVENLVVMNFHTFCHDMANRADCLPVDSDEEMTSEYFSEVLPSALVKALECLSEERFDAIVVDEGQDFAEDWWTILQLAMTDPDHGILYVFHDDNQRIYRARDTLPDDLDEFPLTKNLRNTKTIHELASHFYVGELVAGGPDGRPVEFVKANDNHTIEKEVSRVLHRLIKEDSIKPEEIAVLTGHSLENSVFADNEKIGAFPVTHNQHSEAGKVYVSSIRRFKGLERLVIILVELEDILDSPDILYVGMTRAKAHLIVVGSNDVVDSLGEPAEQETES